MRGIDHQQADMHSYLSSEARVRANHPLRAIRTMADEALKCRLIREINGLSRLGIDLTAGSWVQSFIAVLGGVRVVFYS